MAYHVSLTLFDGPLDLLLHLIGRAQVDIRDIFVSEITDQFLGYMGQLDDLDMDRASEFLEMAARLLEIKSRRLLPGADPGEGEEEENPEQQLIRQLEEYRLFKAASATLQQKEREATGIFYRLPQEIVLGGDFDITNASIQLLAQTFAALMANVQDEEDDEPERRIERESFTVQQQLFRIQGLLSERRSLAFTELICADPTREEIITAFLAVLELIKLNRVQVRQDGLFGTIRLEARARNEEGHHGQTTD